MSGFSLSALSARRPESRRFGTSGIGFPLRDRIAVVAALAAPLGAAALPIPFRAGMASANMALILVVVVAVAANGHRLAGGLAALSSALWFGFFLTRPYERFAVDSRGDVTAAVLLLVVGLVVSQLAARARRLKVVAITDADHLARIHDTAQLTQSAKSADAVVGHGTLLGRPPRIEQSGDLVVGARTWDVEWHGWPQEEIELRAFGNRYCGRFMLRTSPGTATTLQARLVAVTLADQAGPALAHPEVVRGG
ncbi:DUF4118 domain-containing protein [Streptomyces sp. NPDC021093]|uniref:DUF4118 domain-containing protein n=1 Tax=Streptomyces sp. NPDC021093 TaxID=3365112 RepID=UPI0037B3907C